MKTFLVFAISVSGFLLLAGCNKDKFETKPRLEIKDYSDKVLSPGQPLKIRLTYFDKEGDLSEGQIIIRKVRLNKFPPIAPTDYLEDVLDADLPEFPSKDQAEITFETSYERLDESKTKSDTIQYKFAVKDRAGNTSDTIVSDIIVARMP